MPAADRPDPVGVLIAQGESRVQDLLPIRYGRMAESPFGFFRGAAAVMAADLAGTPNTGIAVQLCGDGHLVNFGGFGTPERRLIFDVNDFDETLPGPWEWDLKRLGASFAVAARSKGFDDRHAKNAVERVALSYADALTRLASMPTLDAWYWSIDTDEVAVADDCLGDAKTKRRVDKAIARAHAHDNLQAVDKLTEVVDGHRRIVDQLPLVGHVPGDDEMDRIGALFDGYRASLPDDHRHLLDRFQLVDAARKVVGVGSVGTRCWIALLDGGGDDDPLLLQVKEAEASVLEAHLQPSDYDNHGRRVVEGQRLMQAASDLFLGWTSDAGAARLLLAPAPRHEGFRRCRRPTTRHVPQVRRALRCDPCSSPRAVGRRGRDLRIPRKGQRVRQGPRSLRHSPMPTRTNATTPRSNKRSRTAACPPNPASDPAEAP